MRAILLAGVLLLGLAGVLVHRATSQQADAGNYIKQSEAQWAAASAKEDTAIVERILADDFVGVDTLGNFFRKADELQGVGNNDGGYASGESSEVNVRIYGDAAVAQGTESWQKKSGERGRYAWTDTWIRRNGKWQVVASEDVKLAEPSK